MKIAIVTDSTISTDRDRLFPPHDFARVSRRVFGRDRQTRDGREKVSKNEL